MSLALAATADADTAFRAALRAEAAGDLDEAGRLIARAVELAPDDAVMQCRLANLLWRRGQREAAEQAYRAALDADCWLTDALINLGHLLVEGGRAGEAAPLFDEAIGIDPRLAGAWRGRALMLAATGRHDEAIEVLREAVGRLPEDGLLRLHLGNLLCERQRHGEALAHLEAAAASMPERADAANNLGMCLSVLKQHARAAAVLAAIVARWPDFPEGWNNYGNSLQATGDAAGALAAFERAATLAPHMAVAHANRANMLRLDGRTAESDALFRLALDLEPDMPNALNGLALLRMLEGRHDEAVGLLEQAVAVRPDYVEALNNMAVAQTEAGRFHDAALTYQRLLAVRPDLPEALFNLGTLFQHIGAYDQSIAVFAEAIRQAPGQARAYPYLAHSMMQQCRWENLDAVVQAIRRNTEVELDAGRPVSVAAFGLQSLPGEVPMALRRRAAAAISGTYVRAARPLAEMLAFRHPPAVARRRLRIGYVSPDFRFHSVAVAFQGVLANHDRDAFELHGYCVNTGPGDATTEWFRERFHGFRRIARLPFREAAEAIHGDGIDILVDLAGHTRGNRLDLFALRPAPVQAHWLGYSATIGMPPIEWLITDHCQVPPEQRAHFAERLVYLPDTFMATQRAAIAVAAPDRRALGLPGDGVVFCCFNGCYKLDPVMFGVWMRLLRKLPDSVLWLIHGTDQSVENLRAEAVRRGVYPGRLVFAGRATHPEHLARLRHADLALDTLWHGGGVTTADALWAGVPVVSVAGATPQSRNGASLLSAIGLDELIVGDLGAYERLAFRLARDGDAQAALRARLAANRDAAPLFRPERLTRHLEDGFRLMWQAHVDGTRPPFVEVPRRPG